MPSRRTRIIISCAVVAVAASIFIVRRVIPRPKQITVYPAHPSRTPVDSFDVVGLGDSVTAGSHCGCASFIFEYGRSIAATLGAQVTTTNLGRGGATSGSLLSDIRTLVETQATIRRSEAITVTIGANDFDFGMYTPACDDLSCYQAQLDTFATNLTQIVHQIDALRDHRPTALRITGYWAVWQDGAVGRQNGETYLRIGDLLTRKVNDIAARVAKTEGGIYVDIYTPFRDTDGTRDDTHLLADDGDHPNEAGHHVIAASLKAAGISELQR